MPEQPDNARGCAAVGFGWYDIATVLALMMFITLRALAPVKRAIDRERFREELRRMRLRAVCVRTIR